MNHARLDRDRPCVGIIGLGVIGGSLAMALKRKVPAAKVLGVDEKDIAAHAKALGAVDVALGKEEVDECVASVDVAVLATPIAEIVRLLPRVAAAARPGTIVTDVGSSKRAIVQRAEEVFAADRYFVGGHPMAGSERQGLPAADPLLFENAVWVLTPARRTPAAVVRSLGGLLERVGAKVLIASPALHDRVAAAVSHLPQLLAVALVNMVARHQEDTPHVLKLAAGGFRDMTRIATSPANTMMIDNTAAKIGRSMKNRENMKSLLQPRVWPMGRVDGRPEGAGQSLLPFYRGAFLTGVTVASGRAR